MTSVDRVAFVIETAPDDVGATVRWMLDNGFAEVGGCGNCSGFGTSVDLATPGAHVRITVDRGQW